MSGNPLAQEGLGRARLGDGQMTSILPRNTALPLSYTIVQSQHSVALPLSYTIQRPQRQVLLLYYLIGPTPAFAINGDASIITPDQITYTPRTVQNYSLAGQPVLQGYKTMTWVWSTLQEAEAQYILSFYNPQSPQVILTYPDETGTWVQRQVSMLPPAYGDRETVAHLGLSITFTGLLS